ncbi:MAG: hypothetical protein RML72_02245 [Bacteroidia bacterium]|nr:hypothetical protein [Bacteroidia bacterium]MDW8157680.1 hypothetical protein [Bacteroidia bacterium]
MVHKGRIKQALYTLGIGFLEDKEKNEIKGKTSLVQFRIAEENEEYLRIEVEFMHQCVNNKVILSALLHFNRQVIPFGQFYISPRNTICLGLLLPLLQLEWLDIVLYYLLSVGEAYFPQLATDLFILPFDERSLGIDPYVPLRTKLLAPRNFSNPNAYTTSVILARMLAAMVGEKNVISISETQMSVCYEQQWINISLQPLPYARRKLGQGDWSIVLQTEVGVIKYLDSRLLVYLNRKNYESTTLAFTYRYLDSKPLILLQSELVPYLIQYSAYLEWLLNAHKVASNELLEYLTFPYQIQSVIQYKLNL